MRLALRSPEPGEKLISVKSARMLLICISLLAGLAWAPSAQAAFHFMQIREVAPNPGSDPDSAYIELQMYTAGQNFVGGHTLSYYDAAAGDWVNFQFPGSAGNGGNQRTILIGASDSVGAAGSQVAPDFIWNGLGGIADDIATSAVCFETIDCVSWGNFNAVALPSPVGADAPAIAVTESLTRSIARGCATLLDPPDDSNDSAADFFITAPTPRNNATAPTETQCAGPGPGPGPGPDGDTRAPQTRITSHPRRTIRRRTARFAFTSSERGSTFRCKLDRRPWARCQSPKTYRNLRRGRHTFRVAATDRAGNRDATPARFQFNVEFEPRL